MTEPFPFPCREDEERVLAFARGELGPDEAAVVGSHVARCGQCQATLAFEEVRPVLAPFRELRVPETVLDGFVEEVVAAARPSAAEAPGRGGVLYRAAAVMVGALLVTWGLSRGPDPEVASSRLRPAPARTAPAAAPAPPPLVAVKTPVMEILLGQGGASDVVMLVLEGDEAL